MTDSSIPDIPAFADELSPLERAALGLQDELSIFEIGLLTFHEEATYSKRKRLTDFLLNAIKAGKLDAYGDPSGWTVEANWSGIYIRTPYPRCDGHKGSTVPDYSQIAARIGLRRAHNSIQRSLLLLEQYEGDWCLVTRADYLAFVKSPAAHGIPFPDSWKSSQGEPAPLSQSKPDPSERQETAAKRETEAQMHKRECQEIAVRLWAENQSLTHSDLKNHPEMEFYVNSYCGKNTISNWLREVDPRPIGSRRGRPKKYPS